jgi:dCTP deaminase
MILSDTAILEAIDAGDIVIDPFDRKNLGSNSYDVRLSKYLKIYDPVDAWHDNEWDSSPLLDCAKEIITCDIEIPSNGIVLHPSVLYLASTVEYTETHKHVPYLDGRSSVDRLGIKVQHGCGDAEFYGHWTMIIAVTHHVRIYEGIRIGQLTYHEVKGAVQKSYANKDSAGYAADARDPKPKASVLWKSFSKEKIQ